MRTPVLLGSQLVFNLGFYAVVPFLALVLRDDHGLGAAAVGLVLGLRTFAQQGMFLVGGTLADALGPRATILLGCAVRVTGFALLGLADPLPWFVLGVVLTGLGGALFSPGLEVLVAGAEQERLRRPDAGRRATTFALLTVFGETGAVLGPLAGAALLGWGFPTVALAGAALFTLVGLALARLLPTGRPPLDPGPTSPRDPGRRDRPGRVPALRHRTFVAFAALHAVNLLAYNQLYLGIPLEVDRLGLGAGALALVFTACSLLTIALQLPVSRLAARCGARASLRTGYLLVAGGFGVLAVGATTPGLPPLLPLLAGVGVLTVGHLVVTPVGLEQVARFAGPLPRGSFFGLLATAGGVAVLGGNVALGPAYDAARTGSPALPWVLLALLPLLPALLAPRLLPPLARPAPIPPTQPDQPTDQEDPCPAASPSP